MALGYREFQYTGNGLNCLNMHYQSAKAVKCDLQATGSLVESFVLGLINPLLCNFDGTDKKQKQNILEYALDRMFHK